MMHLCEWEGEGIGANKSTDKPDETLASDAKFISGHNPMMGGDSGANK